MLSRAASSQRPRGLAEVQQRSLAELLPWLCLHGDARVLCKDGGLLACFELTGVDADSLDCSAANRVAERVEQALRGLDERFTLWSIFRRRRAWDYPQGQFPNPVAQRIDTLHGARFRAGQQFVNHHLLALLFSPDREEHWWARVLDSVRRPRPARGGTQPQGRARPAAAWRRALAAFDREAGAARRWAALEQDARAFENVLEGFATTLQGLGLRRLTGEGLLGLLNACASPTRTAAPVRRPGSALFLDAALGEDRLSVGADCLQFQGSTGGCRVAALGVKAWPDATVPCLVEALLRVPAELTLVQVFRLVDAASAKAHIQSVQRFHLNLQRSAFSFVREALFGETGEVVDETRAMAAEEAREALAAIGAQRRSYGYFHLGVQVAARPGEDLDAALRACAVAVREAGFLVLREGLHLLSSWSASLPGQWGQLVRWHFIHSGNVADLLPLYGPASGAAANPHLSEQLGLPCAALTCLPGLDRTRFHFNFHQGDLGHCVVLGPSRSGKSMLVNFLLAQFLRYPGARVLIFDKDRSCRIPTLLQGGRWLDPGDAAGLRCNPLVEAQTAAGRRWLQGWLRELLCLRGHAWSHQDEHWLAEALAGLALLPPDQHRLATLQALLPPGLAAELKPWVGAGAQAALFDHAEDGFGLAALTCLEMGELLRDPPLARVFMAYAVRRIDRLLAAVPLLPTVIYIEEAWFMLADPGFRERVRDWLKTLPKRLALVVMATQSLEDLAASPVFHAIADNVPTRIFLANPEAPRQAALYQGQFGLNAAQLQRVARAEAKRQFLIVNPAQSRFIDLGLPTEIVNLLRSDRHAQEVFDRVLAAGPAGGLAPGGLARAYLDALEAAHETA